MSKIILPYQLRDGQKAYAARIMADLNALAGGLNNITVEGLEGGDLESTLAALKKPGGSSRGGESTGQCQPDSLPRRPIVPG